MVSRQKTKFDPLLRAVTKQILYFTLILGIISISIFLYDKVDVNKQKAIMASVGLLWISLLFAYIGYNGNSKDAKNFSEFFIFMALMMQFFVFVALLKEGFFAITPLF